MASVVLHVTAPPPAVWRVIGEGWGDVHRIIPSLSASRLLTPGAVRPGSRRACTLAKPYLGMREVEEEVLAWDEGRSFTYVYDAPPWPMASISNTWALEAEGDGTRLTLTPALRLRGGRWTQWLAPPMMAAMVASLKGDLPAMVAAIERECAKAATA